MKNFYAWGFYRLVLLSPGTFAVWGFCGLSLLSFEAFATKSFVDALLSPGLFSRHHSRTGLNR